MRRVLEVTAEHLAVPARDFLFSGELHDPPGKAEEALFDDDVRDLAANPRATAVGTDRATLLLGIALERARRGASLAYIADAIPVQTGGGDARTGMVVAEAYLFGGRRADAVALLTEIAGFEPRVSSAHRFLAEAALEERSLLAAAQSFERSLVAPQHHWLEPWPLMNPADAASFFERSAPKPRPAAARPVRESREQGPTAASPTGETPRSERGVSSADLDVDRHLAAGNRLVANGSFGAGVAAILNAVKRTAGAPRALEALGAALERVACSEHVLAVAEKALGFAQGRLSRPSGACPPDVAADALDYLDMCISPAPACSDRELSQALLWRARRLIAEGADWHSVESELPTSSSGLTDIAKLKAEQAFRSGDYASANAASIVLAEHAGHRPDGWRGLASVLRREGRWGDMAQTFHHSLEKTLPSPSSAGALAPPPPRLPTGMPPLARLTLPRLRSLEQVRRAGARGEYAAALTAIAGFLEPEPEVAAVATAHDLLVASDINTRLIKAAVDRLKTPTAAIEIMTEALPLGPEATRRWLAWSEDALARSAARSDAPTEPLVLLARRRLARGEPLHAVTACLPSAAVLRARTIFVEADALLANDQPMRAYALFDEAAVRSPHLTQPYRRMGDILRRSGRHLEAARNFEAASLTLETSLDTAAPAPNSPQRIGGIGGKFEIYRFRGQLLAAPHDEKRIGLTYVLGRLYEVRDTLQYRQWLDLLNDPAPRGWRRTAQKWLLRKKDVVVRTARAGGGLRQIAKNMVARLPEPLRGFVKSALHAAAAVARPIIIATATPVILAAQAVKARIRRFGQRAFVEWIGFTPLQEIKTASRLDELVGMVSPLDEHDDLPRR